MLPTCMHHGLKPVRVRVVPEPTRYVVEPRGNKALALINTGIELALVVAAHAENVQGVKDKVRHALPFAGKAKLVQLPTAE